MVATSGAGGAGSGSSAKTTKSANKTATKASGAGTKTKKATPAAAAAAAARRKKAVPKSTNVSSNQVTWNAARASQMDLAQQRNEAAARLSDPLWYRIEDVLLANSGGHGASTLMAESVSVLPEQVSVVEAALSHNHMTRSDVTPQAFACLLEQSRRHALELLADAQDYASAAGRNEITRADLLFASEMRRDHPLTVMTQLPKLNLKAREINRIPLPPIPTTCYSGVLLPPPHSQLTARTYDVVSGAQVSQKMIQAPPSAPNKTGSASTSNNKSSKPSYGAGRGRQIPIVLKKDGGDDYDGGGGVPTPMDTLGSTSAPTPASSPPKGSAPLSTSGSGSSPKTNRP
jgi:Transcription initiation factor IID, 31kD subunit